MPYTLKGASKFVTIEKISPGLENKVKSDIAYHTETIVWRVKFSAPLEPSTVNNVNLYVTNESKVPVKTDIRYISTTNEIKIEPLDTYNTNQSYILHITTKVQSRGGQFLKKPVEVKFHI